jgi:hypothetical protein
MWEMMPISFPVCFKLDRVSKAISRASESRVPKPSSKNSESTFTLELTILD